MDPKEKNSGNLIRKLQQFLERRRGGDFIQATVGEEARGVVVGKNIVKIGTLVIPTLPMLVLAGVLGVAIAAVIFFSYGNFLTSAPSPIPMAMTHLFNVAVADFGELDDPAAGAVRQSEDGEWLADFVFDKLQTRLEGIPELAGDVELQHEHLGFIPGSTPEARQKAAAELARQINADVILHGYLDNSRLPVTLVLEFYISPRLTGAEESTGDNAFGQPVAVKQPLVENPDNRAVLKRELIPRFEALTEFMFGLAFLKADEPNLALQQLELARGVPEWKDEQGKEILYLWIGSTLNELGLQVSQVENFTCPVAENESSTVWDCAWAAYQKALALNPTFARAHVGLGNFYFNQAEQTRSGLTVYICEAYDRAVEGYHQALDPAMEAAVTAYVPVKAYYNIGLAHASKYRNCNDQISYPLAVENLTAAVAAYEQDPDVPLVREIGTKTFYQLGLVHKRATEYDAAVEAFTQTITIAEPGNTYEESWQSIRWSAYNQLGHVYSALAEAGNSTRWQDAIEAYGKVITRYEEKKYGDGIVVSDAYYHLGLAYEALGDTSQARASYGAVAAIHGADPNIVDLAQERSLALGQP